MARWVFSSGFVEVMDFDETDSILLEIVFHRLGPEIKQEITS